MRWLMFITVLSALGLYVVVLGWSGMTFMSYLSSEEKLQLQPIVPVQAGIDDKVELLLTGNGFREDTHLSLFLEVSSGNAIVGSLPVEGFVHDLLRDGDRLYAASDGAGLQIIDISKPLSPNLLHTILGKTPVLDIEKDGSRLYLSCGIHGLLVYDIGMNDRLNQAARVDGLSAVMTTKVHDGFLYVATRKEGLLIFDLEAEIESGPIGKVPLDSLPRNLVFYRHYLYLLDLSGVTIFDLAVPHSPVKVGILPDKNKIKGISLCDDLLFTTDTSGLVSRYRFDDNGQASLLDSRQFPNTGLGETRILADSLFIADGRHGLIVINLDKFVEQKDFGYLEIEDVSSLEGKDEFIYAASFNKGLTIIRKTSISPRQLAAEIPVLGESFDLLLENDRLFVTCSQAGLLIKNLKTGEESYPSIVSNRAYSLKKAGSFLYLAKGQSGLGIVKIGEGNRAEEVSGLAQMSAYNLDLENDLLVVVGLDKLVLLDIQDRTMPKLLDSLEINAKDVAIADGMVYVATGKQGLQIFQVSADRKLQFLSRLTPPWPMSQFASAVKLQVVGGLVYLANGESGLLVVDAGTPRRPRILSSVDLPGFIFGVKVIGDRAYTVSHFKGLQVVDVSIPEKPRLSVHIPLHGLTQGIGASSKLLYLTNGITGVSVLPLPQDLTQIQFLSQQQLKVDVPPQRIPGRYSLQVNNPREFQNLSGAVVIH